MADLLLEYGASDSFQKFGSYLLDSTIYRIIFQNASDNIPLMQWYIDHGVDVNKAHNGNTALHTAVQNRCISVVQSLMQAGASLSIVRSPNFGNYALPLLNRLYLCTVPQLIKHTLENSDKVKERSEYFDMRTILMHASHYRQKGLEADMLAVTNLVPECAALIKSYYIQEEPIYKALEAKPYPSSQSRQALVPNKR